MGFLDDFVMRQIQQIADLVTAIASTPGDELPEEVFQRIDDAYRGLGLDSDLVETLDAASLGTMLNSEQERDALVDLLCAHAEASVFSNDRAGATRRLERAIALMPEGDPRAEPATVRLLELLG